MNSPRHDQRVEADPPRTTLYLRRLGMPDRFTDLQKCLPVGGIPCAPQGTVVLRMRALV